MNMNAIVRKPVSWALTLCLILTSFFILYFLTRGNETLLFTSMSGVGVAWAMGAGRVQNYILDSARRRLMPVWYEPEKFLETLRVSVGVEKDRELIFRTVAEMLDEVFQPRQYHVLICVRSSQGMFSHYRDMMQVQSTRSALNVQAMMAAISLETGPVYLEMCGAALQQELREAGYGAGKRTVLLPFHSPELLEGLIVLGERCDQAEYDAADTAFFQSLIHDMSGILYRLTPMATLETLYENCQAKLEAAEVQAISARKIDSLVNATRQCHHEIRTPLNIIRLGIGRIKTMEDLEHYRKVSLEEIFRAMEIVEETLVITDLNRSPDEQYGEIDVNTVLRRCARLVDKGRYALEVDTRDVGRIRGIASDIQVAVTNLLHNAMAVMPEGGRLRLSSRELDGNVLIEVEDSGPGIPEQIRSRVWEPCFSRSLSVLEDAVQTEEEAERGWGLAIVSRVVSEHHGRVSLASEVGKGTKFTIALPGMEDELPPGMMGSSRANGGIAKSDFRPYVGNL